MKLIDYDYASNNERAYEIGVFVGFNFFDEAQTRHAIESYFGRCDPRIWARVQVIRVVADVKWGLWGLVNARAWARRLRLLQVRPLGPAASPSSRCWRQTGRTSCAGSDGQDRTSA